MNSAHPCALRAISAAALALATLMSSADAQYASSVELGMRQWSTARQAAQSPIATVAAQGTWRMLHVTGNSTAAIAGRAPLLIDGALAAVAAWRLADQLYVDGSGHFGHAWLDSTAAATFGGAEGRVRWEPSEAGGVWLSTARIWAWRPDHPSPGSETGAGLWTTLRRLALSATVVHRAQAGLAVIDIDSSGIDPMTCRASTVESPPWTIVRCMRRSSTTDFTFGARWRLGIAAMGAELGTRLDASGTGPGERVWGVADVNMQLLSNISAVVRITRQPQDILRGLPDRSTMSFGLRLQPGRRPISPTPAPSHNKRSAAAERVALGDAEHDDMRAVRITIFGAHRVELRGDMTAWRSVELESAGDSTWAGRFRMPAGVYHLAIRVNGGDWRAPAGLPTADDGFGNEVAIVVANDRPIPAYP